MRPGDGHFIPLFSLIYLVCFKLSWVNPFIYHVLSIAAFFLSGWIFMKLIEHLARSKAAGILAGIFVLWSMGYTRCLETVFSHSTFCLPVILFAFYSLIKYQQTKKSLWHFFVMACVFVAPLFSAMGILTGGWVIFFTILCLEDKSWKRTIIGPSVVWVLSAVLFLVETKAISVISNPLENLLGAVLLTGKAIWVYTLPRLTSYHDLSWFLIVFFFLMAFVQRKKINFKIVVFFVLWIVGNFLFVYFGRGKWGLRLLYSPRYAFYPSFGIAAIVCLIFGSIVQSQEWLSFFNRKKKILIPVLVLFAGVHIFYQHQALLKQTKEKQSLYDLGLQMESAVDDYFQKDGKRPIFLEDKEIRLRKLYPVMQPMSYYASFLLRGDLREKVLWTRDKTEQNFLQYVKMKQSQYPQFFELLQDAQYFKNAEY
ncbi:MAG: hypothetical protein P9M07_08570 [Candidatus Aceula meridiana]|nr:hypothetical protein [Candidatus Aceula meridiana]